VEIIATYSRPFSSQYLDGSSSLSSVKNWGLTNSVSQAQTDEIAESKRLGLAYG